MIDDWIQACGQGIRWLLGTSPLPDKRRGVLLVGTVAVIIVLVAGIGVAVGGTAPKARVARPASPAAPSGASTATAATLPSSLLPPTTTATAPSVSTTTTTTTPPASHPHTKRAGSQSIERLLKRHSRIG